MTTDHSISQKYCSFITKKFANSSQITKIIVTCLANLGNMIVKEVVLVKDNIQIPYFHRRRDIVLYIYYTCGILSYFLSHQHSFAEYCVYFILFLYVMLVCIRESGLSESSSLMLTQVNLNHCFWPTPFFLNLAYTDVSTRPVMPFWHFRATFSGRHSLSGILAHGYLLS